LLQFCRAIDAPAMQEPGADETVIHTKEHYAEKYEGDPV
jgi:hypothetical protein